MDEQQEVGWAEPCRGLTHVRISAKGAEVTTALLVSIAPPTASEALPECLSSAQDWEPPNREAPACNSL